MFEPDMQEANFEDLSQEGLPYLFTLRSQRKRMLRRKGMLL